MDARNKVDWRAVVSVILGVLALLSRIGMLSIVLCIIGWWLARASKKDGGGALAVIGLWLNGIALALLIVWMISCVCCTIAYMP